MELYWKQVYKHACFLSMFFFFPLYDTPLNNVYLLFQRLFGKAKCCNCLQGYISGIQPESVKISA